MSERLTIATLGGLKLLVDDRPVSGLASRKAQALLVYLACNPRPHAREVLAELLWDERTQSQALANLRVVLSSLRKQLGAFVSTSRESVCLNPQAELWLDVAELETGLQPWVAAAGAVTPQIADQVARAVELYRGAFLEGFYLREASGFEVWLVCERQRLHHKVLDALGSLVEYELQSGAYPLGAEHARRLLELDPLMESAQRQLMWLLAYSGQRAAVLEGYARFRELLAEELAVEPEAETQALYAQIQAGELEKPALAETSVEFPSMRWLEALSIVPPTFLEQAAETIPAQAPVFVAREREFGQLDGYLDAALAGEGGVVFVTGGPGRGKTTLINEFARHAMAANPDLLAVSGSGNAHTGAGDPYLLFRQALSMLAGDVEAKWAAGSLSQEHACRLWGACPLAAQSLAEAGPQLVEVFVSGEGLLSRVAAAAPDQQSLLQALMAIVERQRSAPGDLEQAALFEQYTRVLCRIAEAHPLLVLLDDLQWADAASINLLFHLGRRLHGHRILVLGAYRAEEVALGRGDGRHPLESVLNEFKRQYGEVWIDLGRSPAEENRQFVEAFLDSEANLLGKRFREALYAHTEGHPLFTIEMLRDLQERGDLVQDGAGRWVEGPGLDWSVLPARVEGVIEERIGRLEAELRELLAVASVEGEYFTAQVVARVQELNERKLLRRLSEELERRHRLVHARGEASVGDQILSQYRFRHALFQQFMYNGLAPGERRWLHKEIAAVLEQLYAGNTAAISLQLAHHYSQANEAEKAVPYLLQAGDQARNLYAHQEAVGYYQRALAFQEGLGDYEGAARTQMKLGQTYHSAFDYRRANESYTASFSLWRQASKKRAAVPPASSPHALRLSFMSDPSTLDPHLAGDYASGLIIQNLFSGLLEYTPEMDVVPDLARRWEILEGGRKYIFHLREDAHWSDGVPITADDFVYAWRRLLNPATQSSGVDYLYDIKGARAFHLGETSERESLGIRATSPYTLQVELEAPAGYFLQLMASEYPVPRHVVDRLGEDWTEVGNLVVNGPFRIESWQHGKSMSLVRNPKYHGRFSGNLQRVEETYIPDSEWAALLSMYEANELDVLAISYFPPAEMNRVRRQRSSEYITTPMQSIHYLVFNTSRAPFDDPRVRRAFMMALDREVLRQAASRAAKIPAMGGLIPPGIPGHSPEIGLPYDPDGARELMAQAGYPGGRGFPVVEVLLRPELEILLESTMLQWQELLGVEHTLDFVHVNDIPERARVMPPHMVLRGWIADYPDPDNFLRVGFERELSGWQGEAFERLVESARRTQDQVKRIRLYQQADKMLIDEAVVLPLGYDMLHHLVKPWVKNYPFSSSPMGTWLLKDVVIEPH